MLTAEFINLKVKLCEIQCEHLYLHPVEGLIFYQNLDLCSITL